MLDDVENALAELADQLPGIDRTDALDETAAEVFLDALAGGGGGTGDEFRPELRPKLTVLNPAALGGHPFARIGGGQRPDDGRLLPPPFHLDLQHRKARFLIEEGDALEQA